MTSGQAPPTDIVFFGTEDFSLYSLQALVESGYHIAAVVTKPDTPRGRHHELTAPAVKTYAIAHGIPVWQPAKLSTIASDIATLTHPAGILVSYGRIIPQSIIDCFTPGIINIHPSLLPKYRGSSPIESAILRRDATTGVSLMQLSHKMDAGAVYHQSSYPLDSTETRPQLYLTLGLLGAQLLLEHLPSILDGSMQPIPQAESEATYCHQLTKQDSYIDPAVLSAIDADAHVRAYLDFPGTRTAIYGIEVILISTYVSAVPTDLSIRCSDGKYLAIEVLKPIGKKEMPARAFLAGYSRRASA